MDSCWDGIILVVYFTKKDLCIVDIAGMWSTIGLVLFDCYTLIFLYVQLFELYNVKMLCMCVRKITDVMALIGYMSC